MVAPIVGLAARWALTRAVPWVAGGLGRVFFGSATRTVATGLTADFALNNGNLTKSAGSSVAQYVGDKALGFLGVNKDTATMLKNTFSALPDSLNKLGGQGTASIVALALSGIMAKTLLPESLGNLAMVAAMGGVALKIASNMMGPAEPKPALAPAPVTP